MFQFPGYAPRTLRRGSPDFIGRGCPIRTSADHRLFASTRSFSQLITSFFAFESLGILHTLLLTSFYFTYVLAYSILLHLLHVSPHAPML